jgi:thiamine kinase-like enzyme
MQATEVSRAIEATTSIAAQLGLPVDDTTVLSNSNKLALRLMPCDVVARVAHAGHEVLRFEVDVAHQLATTGSPVATLDPRAEARVYEADGFVATLWTNYEPAAPRDEVSPADYAIALAQLHAGLRMVDVAMPHFTDRVAEAQSVVADRDQSPALADADRELLTEVLRSRRRVFTGHGGAEQPLHGEPHPGNLLRSHDGLRFIDFETCCRGPVEFDLAHVPAEVSTRYPGADPELLSECRHLVLAMVAAWRYERGDQLPNGREAGERLLRALRAGPPWVTLDAVTPPVE